MDSKTYTDVTPAQFSVMRTQLLADHSTQVFGTDTGTITGHGVSATYSYDAAAATLTVAIVRHPFFVPASMIFDQLGSHLAKAASVLSVPTAEPEAEEPEVPAPTAKGKAKK